MNQLFQIEFTDFAISDGSAISYRGFRTITVNVMAVSADHAIEKVRNHFRGKQYEIDGKTRTITDVFVKSLKSIAVIDL